MKKANVPAYLLRVPSTYPIRLEAWFDEKTSMPITGRAGFEYKQGVWLPPENRHIVFRFAKVLNKKDEDRLQTYNALEVNLAPVVKDYVIDLLWDLIKDDVQVFEPELYTGTGKRINGYKLLNITKLVSGVDPQRTVYEKLVAGKRAIDALVTKEEDFMEGARLAREREATYKIYASPLLRERILKAKIKDIEFTTAKEHWLAINGRRLYPDAEYKPLRLRILSVWPWTNLSRAKYVELISEIEEALCKELETLMMRSNFLKGAPFDKIGIILRCETRTDEKPCYREISESYKDLPLSISININELRAAQEIGTEALKKLFKIAALKCLVDAGKTYKLPYQLLESELNEAELEKGKLNLKGASKPIEA